jgi:hypothetical protein
LNVFYSAPIFFYMVANEPLQLSFTVNIVF